MSTVVAAVVVKVFYCLIKSCIGCNKLLLEKYFGHTRVYNDAIYIKMLQMLQITCRFAFEVVQ